MIRLHHCPETRSMRTLWLLYELEVEFELVLHAFDKSLRAPDYLTLSPAGRVPALEIEGERMFESGAIAEYLCERFPQAGMGRAPGAPDRMAWLTWLHFAETVSQHVAALTQQHIVLREDHMRSAYVMKLEAARLGKCYDAIEARLSPPLEARDYLLTSGFSAVDVGVGQAVHLGRHFVSLENHPKLAAWYGRITDRDAFRRSLPAPEERLYTRDFYPPWPV
ncbi:glutathione S-transferase family protein [Aestuariicoccus sp. MJ-SS9]|uniref:glutathione S-transferase family protein n=1 Tax=Aestuariicoccus sp. MJ-SS9 TaxID=3079855 RepID=UPI0029144BC4|nr:glutathione S-transferase family protein [Aestuariicoccus sp. MJ-SS9]MDU8910543.1 glutathione S-transferase family protein [Aestuariicoccus sp. MJ-SS9]